MESGHTNPRFALLRDAFPSSGHAGHVLDDERELSAWQTTWRAGVRFRPLSCRVSWKATRSIGLEAALTFMD